MPEPTLACGPRVIPAATGTMAGYQRHIKRGETVCGPCRMAMRQWARERKAGDRIERDIAEIARDIAEEADVDEVAVARAVRGEPVSLSRAEKRAAIRVLMGQGMTTNAIRRRLRCAPAQLADLREGVSVDARAGDAMAG